MDEADTDLAVAGAVDVTRHDAGTWLIALEGEHDLFTAPLIAAETDGIWPGCRVAIVDLTQATLIDCRLVAWLLRTQEALTRDGGGVLRVVHPETPNGDGAVARMVDALDLRHRLACYPTLEAALRASSPVQGV